MCDSRSVGYLDNTLNIKAICILFFLMCVTFFALRLFYRVIDDDILFLLKFSFIKPKSSTVHIPVTVVTFVADVSHLRFSQWFCSGLCQ
jgi:hypothetical protein